MHTIGVLVILCAPHTHVLTVQSSTSITDLYFHRVLVGAPKGSYPGGLNLSDPELPAASNTGLVYSCPIGSGNCEGVRGDTSVYIGVPNINITNGFQPGLEAGDTREFFIDDIAEGKLFDQTRKY